MRFAAVLLLMFAACSQPPATPATASEPATPAPAAPAAATKSPRVIFPDGFAVNVEVVADDESRAQGLMHRDHLRPDQGMLFLFKRDDEHAFWMKNTLIPLDMIWIDASEKVVAVKYNVPPCRIENCPSYPPGVKSRYVLEVGGGVAKAHGIVPGNQLRFEQTNDVVIR